MLGDNAFFVQLVSPVTDDGWHEVNAAMTLDWHGAAEMAYKHCFRNSRTRDLQKAVVSSPKGTTRAILIRDPSNDAVATIICAPMFTIYGLGLMSMIAANRKGLR